MALVINVAYSETNAASSYVWKDASFKTIGNVLPTFHQFSDSDVITSGSMHYIRVRTDKRLRRIISPSGRQYAPKSATNSGGFLEVNVGQFIKDGQLPAGIWKLEFFPEVQNVQNSLYDLAAVKNSIKNLFSFFFGERIILPEYGSVLPRIIGSSITDAQVLVIKEQIRSMMKWEPRAQINDIQVRKSPDEYEIGIKIFYSVPELSVTQISTEYLVKISND